MSVPMLPGWWPAASKRKDVFCSLQLFFCRPEGNTAWWDMNRQAPEGAFNPAFHPKAMNVDDSIDGRSSGLCPHRLTFPSPKQAKPAQFVNSGTVVEELPGDFPSPAGAGGRMGIYSYGDSAGFPPVFPFNDARRQPRSARKYGFFGIAGLSSGGIRIATINAYETRP